MADPYLLDFSTLADGAFVQPGWTRTAGSGTGTIAGGALYVPDAGAVYNYDLGAGSDTGVWLWTQRIAQDIPDIFLRAAGGFNGMQVFPDPSVSRFRIYTGSFTDVSTLTPLVAGDLWDMRMEIASDVFTFHAKPSGAADWEVTASAAASALTGTQVGLFLSPVTVSGSVSRFEYNPDPAYVPSGSSDVTPPSVYPAITSPSDGTGTYYTPATVILIADDDAGIESAQYDLDGAGWVDFTNGDQITITGAGSHTLVMQATDTLGNASGAVDNGPIVLVVGVPQIQVTVYDDNTPSASFAVAASDPSRPYEPWVRSYSLDGAPFVVLTDFSNVVVTEVGAHTVVGRGTDSTETDYDSDPVAFTVSATAVPSFDLPEPPDLSTDVWGVQLNEAIRTMHLGPASHEELPDPANAVERAIFVCTTHSMVHINVQGAWIDYFVFPG